MTPVQHLKRLKINPTEQQKLKSTTTPSAKRLKPKKKKVKKTIVHRSHKHGIAQRKQKKQEDKYHRFEKNLHQQWAKVRLTTFDQHKQSLLKWTALKGESYELTIPQLGFRLEGRWQAYETARGTHYQLLWYKV